MKSTFLISTLLFSFGAFAQSSIQVSNHTSSVVLTPNSTVTMSTIAEDVVKVTFDIKNTSATTKHYKARRYDLLLHATPTSTASAYFCFAGTCYPADTDIASTSLTLSAGASASEIQDEFQMLEADLYEAETMGYSLVKYTFFNVDDVADSVQITVQYNDLTTGLPGRSNDRDKRFVLYPNPSQNGIVFLSPSVTYDRIEVLNILGAVVYSRNSAGPDSNRLNLKELPAGTYFVNIHKGDYYSTHKLVIAN
jgi:hypothetical protein